MGAIKFDLYNNEADNFETIQAEETVKDWLETIRAPFEPQTTSVEALEFRRRSGFIPHRHNRGGLDLFTCSDIYSIHSNGEHHGTLIEEKIEKYYNETEAELLKQDPTLEVEKLFDEMRDATSGDYDAIAWRVRVMYAGNGSLTVFAGYDLDAPYFRWNSGSSFEKTIQFKTLKGLARQLKAMTKEIEASQDKPKEIKK